MSSPTPQLPLPGAPDENGATIVPASLTDVKGKDEAANVIRNKINSLYAKEPNAEKELEEASEPGKHSEHQLFLIELHKSGASAEEIQVKWHEYYGALTDQKKHEVWQEFYSNQNRHTSSLNVETDQEERQLPKVASRQKRLKSMNKKLKKAPKPKNLTLNNKMGAKHHFKSILFGLGVGAFVLFVFMFTFFNERYIRPFIQPNQIASATPIITVPGAVVSSDPKVIIPKLNTEAPVVYDVPFIQPGEDENDFEDRTQKALENGVVHYPTSQKPGETGRGFNSNTVIVGHSSNNLFNRGKYKFAFMQIGQLEPGDIFMINYNSIQYTYKVYEKKVVEPTEVGVLGAASRPNSATLITCDPPGLNINRMVIVAEQISPNSATNVLTAEQTQTTADLVVPGNPKTMWQRLWGWVSGG